MLVILDKFLAPYIGQVGTVLFTSMSLYIVLRTKKKNKLNSKKMNQNISRGRVDPKCHDEKRPEVSKFPKPKLQIKEGHYEKKNCSSCHKTETNKNKWYFDHSDSKDRDIKFCLPCHKTAGKRKHFYAIPFGGFRGDGNCYTCHNKKRQSWKAK